VQPKECLVDLDFEAWDAIERVLDELTPEQRGTLRRLLLSVGNERDGARAAA
jgi:hypothetical protein